MSRIASASILDVLDRYIHSQSAAPEEVAAAIGERVGLTQRSVLVLLKNRPQTLDFDLADRLLCSMNLVHLWWNEPLRETYFSIDLDEREQYVCRRNHIGYTYVTPGGRRITRCPTCAHMRDHGIPLPPLERPPTAPRSRREVRADARQVREQLLAELRDGKEHRVNEICSSVGLSRASVYRHLRSLEDNGLVEVRREPWRGPYPLTFYRIALQAATA